MTKIFCNETFPITRLRRNRKNQAIRNLFTFHQIDAQNLIYPLFICDGNNQIEKVENLPDIFRYSVDLIARKAQEAHRLGICSFMLFPATPQYLKNPEGSEALNPNNLVCRAIKEIKELVPEALVIADIALDPYTSHGHDGLIDNFGNVLNDESIEVLCEQALILAQAGCDIVAPSDMMDGRVRKIRQALDGQSFIDVGIFSYSAKYASNFYAPFRNAVGSQSNLKKSDKKSYQMDYCRNSDEAIQEIALDVQEGADAVIIKPATFYLDIITRASEHFTTPIIGYQVSGEYAMLKYLAASGFGGSFSDSAADFADLCSENLVAIRRAGATAIITYAAVQLLKKIE